MNVRKLKQEEHIRTRKLWEEIFTEDTKEFLDYYYSVKTKENEIYVIEDEGKIVSMLHLNPYQMRIKDTIHQTHYIVAVATDKHYRKRGLMRQLLNYAMNIMAERGEPFTFLMPAAEAIYKPFGFEFVYGQGRTYVMGKHDSMLSEQCGDHKISENSETGEMVFALAQEGDCEEMSHFANECLKSYDITTWRTPDYYKTILAEQISQNGGILLAKQNGHIKGVFCFAKEGRLELREPLFLDEKLLQQAVYYLVGNDTEEILCIGYGEQETKPMIMAKVLHPELIGDLHPAKIFLNEVV